MLSSVVQGPCFRPALPTQRGQRNAIFLVQAATRSVKAAAQSSITGTRLIGGGGANSDLFVAGADGQLGANLVQKLLQAGFKVTAGVSDEEQARAVLDFAQRVELITKKEATRLQLAELDLSDQDSIAAALPKRGGRIMAVVGEGSGRGPKLDARSATRVLLAAQEVGASQFILVTPSGAAGGGSGFFGALFGGGGAGGGSGNKPSKLEQDIAASGLDFIVVRTARTDLVEEGFAAANHIALGAQGSLPSNTKIAKSQVADVVTQVLRLADSDVLVEAWASPAEESPQKELEDLVAEVLPTAAISEKEQAEDDDPTQDASEEQDEPTLDLPKPASLFGGFGTKKVKAGSAQQEAQPEVGTRKINLREAATKPAKRGLRFGRQPSEDTSEEEEEATNYNPTDALASLFGGKKKVKEEVQPTVEKARKSAAEGVKAVGKAAQRGAATTGSRRRGSENGEAPKKPTFLESIGLGATKYIDDDDD